MIGNQDHEWIIEQILFTDLIEEITEHGIHIGHLGQVERMHIFGIFRGQCDFSMRGAQHCGELFLRDFEIWVCRFQTISDKAPAVFLGRGIGIMGVIGVEKQKKGNRPVAGSEIVETARQAGFEMASMLIKLSKSLVKAKTIIQELTVHKGGGLVFV